MNFTCAGDEHERSDSPHCRAFELVVLLVLLLDRVGLHLRCHRHLQRLNQFVQFRQDSAGAKLGNASHHQVRQHLEDSKIFEF